MTSSEMAFRLALKNLCRAFAGIMLAIVVPKGPSAQTQGTYPNS